MQAKGVLPMKRGDAVLLIILLVLLSGSWLYIGWLRAHQGDQLVATVTVNGNSVKQIDLNTVSEPYQFRVDDGNGGYNIVQVERGRIRVVEANCQEQVDVRQGWISEPNQSIICLPHRFVVRLVASGQSDVDGIVK